ncbi:MAG: hypothetical protein R3D62_14760 [Xanthobacteraceae bacterium]
MTTVTKTAIALALTIITATGALAAPRKSVRVPSTTLSAAALYGPGIGLPFAASPEQEALIDPAKGYPSGY